MQVNAHSDIFSKAEYRHYRLRPNAVGDYNGGMKLRLKELRKAKKLTQQQLASMAGISQSYYTELENGRKTINANRMESLSKALGVSPQDLIVSDPNGKGGELMGYISKLNAGQKVIVLNLAKSLIEASDTPE